MRESGILMHITSLPTPYGIGTMGKDAYAFVDFLVKAGQRCWQILPLTPTGYGDSPYQSLGACAGNHYLIDLDTLVDEGLLKKEEIQNIPWGSNPARVDFGAMYAHRMNVLRLAFQRFAPDEAYETFVEQNRSWLEDYALFTALKDTLGGKPWLDWPEDLRPRKADALAEKRRELGLTEQDFLILTVAEMTKNKNHSTVLKALALLKNEPGYESMHYLICGRGEQRDALEEEARQLGIWEHVHFLGYRHDVPELCRCSDIFAFMSFREGMPVALMEAMSCGLPAVCSKIRGNTDLIEDGIDGLFAENTPRGVAAAILKLYHDPALRGKLGRAAAQTVSRFDAKAVQQKMKEIYLSV